MIIDNYEVVHFHLWNPYDSFSKQSRNEKAEARIVMCNNKCNCNLYKVGQCTMRGVFIEHCPYGKCRTIEGFSRRSNKFSEFIRNIKEQYKNVGSLSQPVEKMVVIGEYIYLPYQFINFEIELPFIEKGGFFNKGNRFMILSNFTVDVIKKIVTDRKYAMTGGEIKDYQVKVVPLFIKHLSEIFPDLYKELCNIYEPAISILEKYSFIGRKAYLKTTNKNFVIKNKGKNDEWFWDGEKVICKYINLLCSPLDDYENANIYITPNDKSVITITDDAQVLDNTIFVD